MLKRYCVSHNIPVVFFSPMSSSSLFSGLVPNPEQQQGGPKCEAKVCEWGLISHSVSLETKEGPHDKRQASRVRIQGVSWWRMALHDKQKANDCHQLSWGWRWNVTRVTPTAVSSAATPKDFSMFDLSCHCCFCELQWQQRGASTFSLYITGCLCMWGHVYILVCVVTHT